VIAAGIFDHPGFLLLIAFITLVRWLVARAKSPTQTNQTPIEPPPAQPISRGGETRTEEERIRKFLEALGQPAGSAPPKATPRPRPVVPKIFPKLPPLKTAPPPLPPQPATWAAPPPPLPIERISSQSPLAFEVHDVSRETAAQRPAEIRRAGATRFDPRGRLGTPQDLRTAIILREIFGPPRSLQPVDLTSGS
jgi:hypothetical protein